MTIDGFWRETLKDSKKLMALATPIILSSVTTAALVITDSYFLSRLDSPVPLAGYGLVATFVVVFFATVYGFLNPLATMVAQAAGRQEYKKVGEVVRVGCFMALTAGSVFGLLFLASYFLLTLFGQPPAVVAVVFGYWLTAGLSMGLWAAGYVIKQTLDALQKPWTATLIYSSMIVVNLPVGYVLIFGLQDWGLPAMDLTGAGWAWLLADIVANLLFLLYFFLSPTMKKYHGAKPGNRLRWFLKTPLDKTISKKFLKGAIPVSIETFFEVFCYAMLGIMVGWFGIQALAARQISNGFLEMLYMIPLSMTYATTIVVADMVGKKQFSRLRIAGMASIFVVSCFTLLSVLFLLLVGNQVAIFFGGGFLSADVIVPLAASFLLIGALAQVADGLQSTMLGALRGLGDFTFSSIVSIVGYMLCLLLAYVFGFHVFHHPIGIIAGFIIGIFLLGIVLAVRFWQKTSFTK